MIQQYVYCDIGHRGYQYAASDSLFFDDEKKKKSLLEFVNYESSTMHGDLQPGQHQSFSLVYTDLKKPGEKPHLFVQAAGAAQTEEGADTNRMSFCAHGFFSDSQESDILGTAMLRLLRSQFLTSAQAMKKAEAGQVEAYTVDTVPVVPNPGKKILPDDALQYVLNALMQDYRVIIRLNSTGYAAMAESRDVAYEIYSRLPYGFRSRIGFLSGVSPVRIQKDTLNSVFNLITMDADSDMTGICSDGFRSVVDLTNAQVRYELPGKTPEPVKQLLEWLITANENQCDAFFQFCLGKKKTMSLQDYASLFLIYRLKNVPMTPEIIRFLSVLVLANKTDRTFRQYLFEELRGSLTTGSIASYYRQQVTTYEEALRFGIADSAEEKKALYTSGKTEAIQDLNGGISAKMFDLLFDKSSADRPAVVDAVASHFTELACKAYPSLDGQTISEEVDCLLAEIPLPNSKTNPFVADICALAASRIQKKRDQVHASYQNVLNRSKARGMRIIGSVPAPTGQGIPDLKPSYTNLLALPLAATLFKEKGSDSWNAKLAAWVETMYSVQPETVPAISAIRSAEAGNTEIFEMHGGTATQAMQRKRTAARECWSKTQKLWDAKCKTLKELLDYYGTVDRDISSKPLALQFKQKMTDVYLQSGPTGEEFLTDPSAVERRDKAEAQLLGSVMQRIPSFGVIGKDVKRGELERHIQLFEKWESQKLFSKKLQIAPWGVEARPREAAEQIRAIQADSAQFTLSGQFDCPKMQQWVAKNYPDKRNVQLYLARCSDKIRSSLAAQLSRQEAPIASEWIWGLYIAGYSREDLLRQSGTKSWNQAVQNALGDLVGFTKYEQLISSTKIARWNRLALVLTIAAAVLIAGAEAAVGFYLGIWVPNPLWVQIAAGAACIGAFLTMLIGSVVSRDKNRKHAMLAVALAQFPGMGLLIYSIIMGIV